MDKKKVVAELKEEVTVLEDRLGTARMALRGLGEDPNDTTTLTVERKRAHITSEMRRRYEREVVAVLASFGASTVRKLQEKGNFEGISRTSVGKIALNTPSVNTSREGKSLVFSLNG